MICPLCGVSKGEALYKLPENYTTRRCIACGFVFMSPRPTSEYLNAYYAEAAVYAYDSAVAADYDNVIRDKIGMIKDFQARFPQLPKTGKTVDFGAGNGAVVKALAETGFDAEGIEISARAREVAMVLFGVPMRDGAIEDFRPDEIHFLTMFDVLEHMLDPKAFLLSLREKLTKDGACLIGVPNFNSLDRLTVGAASKPLIFPEHVNQFTGTTLKALFTGCGFDVLYIGSPPPYGVAISFGLRRNLLKILGRNGFTLGVNRLLVWLKRYIVYPLPNAFVEKTGLLGQSLLILAMKARD